MHPTRVLGIQPSRAFMHPAPKESMSGTVSSFIQFKDLFLYLKIPPELIPLGIVLAVAVGAGIYSSARKLLTDKTLRLSRNKPEDHH
ncbi:hypothetical protein Egran_00809 [Elaphomyces granulatus]|uniref:Uncharacterized protein n=1 Tax=Elaphomyces granulatus TaxID=519963 RepID=A0A232M4T0_9EURO|nr:hypothetical protein Egran_00809 [Elaphomyces granulatus]